MDLGACGPMDPNIIDLKKLLLMLVLKVNRRNFVDFRFKISDFSQKLSLRSLWAKTIKLFTILFFHFVILNIFFFLF
jgi:hypothetical protein